jgi:hypothetical protein
VWRKGSCDPGDGLAEVVGGDGLVRDDPVPGREPRDRAAAEVHDKLPHLRVPRQPTPHPRRHRLQERVQLSSSPRGRRLFIDPQSGRRRPPPRPVSAHGRLLRGSPAPWRGAADAERGRVERPEHGAPARRAACQVPGRELTSLLEGAGMARAIEYT